MRRLLYESEVFCDEQGYSPEMELDELDRTSRHVLLYRGDEPVATGRLYEKRPGRDGDRPAGGAAGVARYRNGRRAA